MAAYAALVSLMNIIDEIQQHPRPPISLDEQQLQSLTKNVTFLQEFLEGYNSAAYNQDEADPFEIRIAEAAYAAEDVIESHIVDQLEEMRFGAGSNLQDERIRSTGDRLYEGVKMVIEEMESSIKKEVTKIQAQVQKVSSTPAASAIAHSTGAGSNKMVGFDDVFLEILEKLTGGEDGRQIIPIAGMGGCGKTTLARNVYSNSLIKEHFDICAWTTISQEFDANNIICQLLGVGYDGSSSLHTLGERLHKYLFGRRYLVILDDMWSIEVWDKIQFFFPKDSNGSRIITTTRLSNLGTTIGNSPNIDMGCLDEDSCWSLFCETVFGEDACPSDLRKIGKRIVRSCKGLPLSIVVIGGLLAKSTRSQEYWEYIGENISSTVNLEDDEHWLRALRLSYSQLPVHLKPCFLYMGVFKEDVTIAVSSLVRLWIAEGFLKPVSGKSMEVVARDYLHDLIDRNLVLVDGLGRAGNVRICKVHDLLRDLCIREAERERFYSYSVRGENHSRQRRLVILKSESSEENNLLQNSEDKKFARSLIYDGGEVEPSADLRMLRVSNAYFEGYERRLWNIASYNSRYLAVVCREDSDLLFSIKFTWNLQSLFVNNSTGLTLTAPVEIWNMSRLRYVHFLFGLCLPEPPPMEDGIVLGNLQVLKRLQNFKCGENVVERIPNIKKLDVFYKDVGSSSGSGAAHEMYCLSNIERLHKLENLSFQSSWPTEFVQTLTFPHSLKKLRLTVFKCLVDDAFLAKIGSLPHLEKLLLSYGCFQDGKWETVDGQFRSLKYLELDSIKQLEYWTTESSHFPCLEKLLLCRLFDLKELPSEIGEIPTLKTISILYCDESLVRSAKEMMEEQEELHGENLPLRVEVVASTKWGRTQLQSLASANFRIHGLNYKL